jgi:hypothetical protein
MIQKEIEEKTSLEGQNQAMLERLREMKATVGPRLQAEIVSCISNTWLGTRSRIECAGFSSH